ncbi:protein serine/threonine phosphatase 2C [Ceraceosorus guamensis]|uniref:Protein serine/threonine phosphatase 2C n=1 Tax=Ceraceosorus guamensis TaxID=1522189 RepID=A0A316VX28_9BASI|nr:protein serine/threonine phosphatase 2C [Ceraceosorus guamensis]PWN42012.1 protein serine/threonine phosphatase 2C [Ceraceosorus guamensis]
MTSRTTLCRLLRSTALSPPHRSLATCRACPLAQLSQARHYRPYVRVRATGTSAKDNESQPCSASARIPLRAGSVFGVSSSRGSRAYQEDAWSASCVLLPPKAIKASLASGWSRIAKEAAARWHPESDAEEAANAQGVEDLDDAKEREQALMEEYGQIVWFGCFDGHGGRAISTHLKDTLHATFESADPRLATKIAQFTRSLGGYFRRFAGGGMQRWVRQELLKPVRAGRGSAGRAPRTSAPMEAQTPQDVDASDSKPAEELAAKRGLSVKSTTPQASEGQIIDGSDIGLVDPPDAVSSEEMTIAERCTLAWLMADKEIQQSEQLNVGGSTASVALLHSLDVPATPWYSSRLLSITTAQIGDTRLLLCGSDGRAIPLTNYHHPDDRGEADRLRKVGAGMITDSFGEARWMGALANTRAFGDSGFKKAGVTAEPEVITQVIKGDDYAFVIAFSDGVGEKVSDQEVVDLCRGAGHPSDAAKAVLSFAEELGAEDNGTVLVIPLRGWGKVGGEDTTRAQREFRKSKTDVFREGRR